MYGFKPRHAQGEPVQNLADGGIVNSLTGMLGMRKRTPEEMLAADAKVQERNREAAARVAASAKPAQQAAPAEEKAVSSYAGMSAMQRREKELGLKDGGIVGGFKPGGLIRGPGTGTSDSIETEKRPGTFIMPADSTQAIGPEALQSLGAPKGMPEAEGMEEPGDMDDRDEPDGEKVPVRLSNGEFELPPEQVQALGEAVLTVMRNATHQPVGEHGKAPTGKGFTPHQFFSGGGTVQDKERLERINQIPAGSDVQAPAPDGQDSTELTRNVNNGLNALGGMGVVASVPLRAGQAAKAAATGSGATALPSGIPRLAGPAQAAAAPAADFVAGMGPGATTYANTIPRIGNAPTQALPAVSAALQEGAQANVLAAAARTAAGANAAAPDQPANPALAAPIPATPGGAVFGFYPQLAGGQRTTYATDAKLRTGVQATGPSTFAPATPSERTIIGGGNGQRMNAAQDPRSLTYGATAGNDTAAPVAPAAPNPTDQRIAAGAQQAPAAATQPASAMVAPGAYRNAPGQYSDNAAGMAMPAGFTGQPSAQNMAAADALAARQTPAGFQPAGSQPAGVQAPVVRNSTNDWAARKALENAATAASSITANGGRFDQNGRGGSPQAAAYRAALANDFALQQAQPNMEQAAMRENAGLQREGMQQEGATTRTGIQEQGSNTRDARRNALTAEELGLRREAAGFQTRAAAQQEQLRNVLLDPKATPEQRKQAQEYLQALAVSDKEPSPQYKSYVMPAIRNADGSTTEGGVYQENTRTGEGRWVKPQGDGQAQQGALPKVATPQDLAALKSGTRFVDSNGVERIKK